MSSESYKMEAVPQSFQGNDSPMAMPGKVTQVSIPSANGDQKSNGKLRFVLPNNNISISRRSMFIRARCSISFSATIPTNTDFRTSVWFQGPGWINTGSSQSFQDESITNACGGPGSTGSELPQLGNAYSLIQRSTVYSGSNPIDMIDYVCDLMSGLILPHSTNQTWIQNDGSIFLGINNNPMRSTSLTTGGFIYWDLAIPVPHTCFNTKHDFPAYLLSDSNPLSLEIDLTPFNRAIAYGSSISPIPIQDFIISRAALCYEAVELPREFIEAQRLATKKIPFIIPQLSYMINQMPISALTNYNAILKLSSLRAVYILPYNNATYVSLYPSYPYLNRAFGYQRNASDIASQSIVGDYSGSNVQLFVDGRCINQINLDNPTMTFVALKQALRGSITDSTVSSLANNLSYKYCYFALGIDTTCFSDESTVMGGTSVNEVQVVLTNFITNATTGRYLANIIFAYDSLIIIKNGKITTKR